MNYLLHSGDLVRVSHATEKARDFTGIIIEICHRPGMSGEVVVLWADGNIARAPEYTLKKIS